MSDETSTAGSETQANGTPVTGTPATGETPASTNLRFKSLEEAHKEYERLEAKYREESKTSAERRVKLKQFEDAQLSESERDKKALAEAQQAHSEILERYQRQLVYNAVLEAAPGMGINGKLAARLLNWSSLKIDDDGNVDGLDKALEALKAEFPELAAQQSQAQPPQTQQPRQQVPPTNPPRGGTGAAPTNPRYMSWGEAFNKRQ